MPQFLPIRHVRLKAQQTSSPLSQKTRRRFTSNDRYDFSAKYRTTAPHPPSGWVPGMHPPGEISPPSPLDFFYHRNHCCYFSSSLMLRKLPHSPVPANAPPPTLHQHLHTLLPPYQTPTPPHPTHNHKPIVSSGKRKRPTNKQDELGDTKWNEAPYPLRENLVCHFPSLGTMERGEKEREGNKKKRMLLW